MTRVTQKNQPARRSHARLVILTLIACSMGGWFLYSHHSAYSLVSKETVRNSSQPTTLPFPISVNPQTQIIADHPLLDDFITTELASNHTPPRRAQSLFALLTEEILTHHWYQQLASPVSRTLVIYSGQRTEEIAAEFGKILRWSTDEVTHFEMLAQESAPFFLNGTLYPGRDFGERNSRPETVMTNITERFDNEIHDRYTPEIESVVPLADALVIASLIEREAYDFTDMRVISGVIWNRLFINMPLQIDATLQYVKGSAPDQPWWPVPRPADKFLDSPYNTYQNKGLPPEPIANPSVDAIVAALNPIQTNCLFYFHTNDGSFFCTETYEEHTALLKEKFKLTE